MEFHTFYFNFTFENFSGLSFFAVWKKMLVNPRCFVADGCTYQEAFCNSFYLLICMRNSWHMNLCDSLNEAYKLFLRKCFQMCNIRHTFQLNWKIIRARGMFHSFITMLNTSSTGGWIPQFPNGCTYKWWVWTILWNLWSNCDVIEK